MAEEILFQSDYVTITPTVARFGNTSYQISNIGSLTVQSQRRLNGNAIGITIAGFAVVFLMLFSTDLPYVALSLGAIAVGLWVLAFIWQQKWPINEHTIVLRTSSGDLQVLTTQNKDYFTKVHDAIKTAFDRRTSSLS